MSAEEVHPGQAEESEDDEDEEEVLLGFTQEPKKVQALAREFFPSKVGGRPAWLDPQDLPRSEQSRCGFCGKVLDFLLQAYAPIEGVESSFHRTVFVFCCRNGPCLVAHYKEQLKVAQPDEAKHLSVRAFRCQLPRRNKFYAYDALPADGVIPDPPPNGGAPAPLCDWCGTWRAEQRCGSCRQAIYCSRDHQVDHWKRGHAAVCRQLRRQEAAHASSMSRTDDRASETGATKGSSTGRGASILRQEQTSQAEDSGPSTVNLQEIAQLRDNSIAANGLQNKQGSAAANPAIFPELELIVEPEPQDDEERFGDLEEGSGANARVHQLMANYEKQAQENDYTAAELLEAEQVLHEHVSAEKAQWAEFEARIGVAPEQVLRYCRSPTARPLWPSTAGRPQSYQIPNCSNCGAARIFEMQVLPQLLYFLRIDSSNSSSLDFGTLAIYTCSNSCSLSATSPDGGVSRAYIEEFAWVQLQA